ncbi:hypothetical protein [Kaistella sp.]|uniref:hypothetical protein n=1 Tax=Kaistella sp. TaxID=2782235 RepID=UPI003C668FDB
MTYTLKLENKEDFQKVKKLLEQIKGAKVFENKEDDSYEDGTPKAFIEQLEKYADSLTEEDYISSEEFFANARKKVCELYSQK